MGQNSETFPVTTKYAPYNYEISKMSKSFPFVVDAKVDILHKDMNKIMEKLDVILSRDHGNQVRTKYFFPVLPTVFITYYSGYQCDKDVTKSDTREVI